MILNLKSTNKSPVTDIKSNSPPKLPNNLSKPHKPIIPNITLNP